MPRYPEKTTLPEAYANTPSAPATSTDGMIARPSRPSVRLTALLDPTITKYVSGMNRMPSGITTCLKNGTYNVVSGGACAVTYSATAAPRPATDCQKYL